MESISHLYQQHITTLQKQARMLLDENKLDALLIHSGEPIRLFLDDRYAPFKANPLFKAWFPVTNVPHCWLLINGHDKPKLWFYLPQDYWHSVEPLPQDFWTNQVDITILSDSQMIKSALSIKNKKVAYLGYNQERALELGIEQQNINPINILNFLHYHRSYKTDYELTCMREAQQIAARGHQAAKHAFYQTEMSELAINTTYLTATQQRDTEVPYDNIVALNEHAAVLHYTALATQSPPQRRSFLLDAGAEYNGYAADITRTYAASTGDEFAALVKDLNQAQLALIAQIRTGQQFVDYHEQISLSIAKLLIKHDLIQEISVEQIMSQQLVSLFFPHGLGHLLGLQVHDVAGFMQDPSGTHLAAPQYHPYLRCTRILEERMVVTIEPGIYFIEQLLAPWRESRERHYFNWHKIDFMKQFGGIRIEDNIVLHRDHVENLTRRVLP